MPEKIKGTFPKYSGPTTVRGARKSANRTARALGSEGFVVTRMGFGRVVGEGHGGVSAGVRYSKVPDPVKSNWIDYLVALKALKDYSENC